MNGLSSEVSGQAYRHFWKRVRKNQSLYILLLPGVLFFLLYKYMPMWGATIAFQNYQPFLGVWKSDWVGLAHFQRLFQDPAFWQLFRNTFLLGLYSLLFFFPAPIIVALLLNELVKSWHKRLIQTFIYVPHFMSWVVIIGIVHLFFSTEGGIVNEILVRLGFEKIPFLLSEQWFRTMIVGEVIWKETGWGTIIFLAALAGVDPQLYEAARMDGANRMRQIWHITLPALRSTIVILLILRLGNFLDTGFEQIFLMLNAMNRSVGEVFDTYVYTVGITQGQFSYSTAVGLFKSLVCLVLVGISNYLAKKAGEEGVF